MGAQNIQFYLMFPLLKQFGGILTVRFEEVVTEIRCVFMTKQKLNVLSCAVELAFKEKQKKLSHHF